MRNSLMGGRETLYTRSDKIRVPRYESNRIEGEILTRLTKTHVYRGREGEYN